LKDTRAKQFGGNSTVAIPGGTAAARPFLPAKDFETSRAFILQRHYQEGWAGNFMMQLMVDDLDAWWTHIQGLDLPGKFGVQPPKAPLTQPWGLRVAYVYDPSGVLWHIAQRRENAPAD